MAESDRARRQDPLSLIIATDRCTILYYSRQYDRAIAGCRAVLDMDPKFPSARGILLEAYVEEGRFAEALETQGGLDNSPWAWASKAFLYGRWGRTAEAQHAVATYEQVAQGMSDRTPSALLAYAATGREDQAITLLQKAYEQYSNILTTLKVDPKYDSMRADPRFQELVRRVGLTQ